MTEDQLLNAAVLRRFYGTDPGAMTMNQFFSLVEQVRRVCNLEAGKPPDGDWFERNTIPGSVRPLKSISDLNRG